MPSVSKGASRTSRCARCRNNRATGHSSRSPGTSRFSFEDVEGTLAGFFTPAFMSSLSVPGVHLLFLSADLRHGGHLLECRPRAIRTGVQFIYGLELALPISMDYLAWDFQRDTGQDLDQAGK
jgi:acetolactate decarboxylase